jgi:hypothetical protein
MRQRRTNRVENFGLRAAMAIFDLLAISVLSFQLSVVSIQFSVVPFSCQGTENCKLTTENSFLRRPQRHAEAA